MPNRTWPIVILSGCLLLLAGMSPGWAKSEPTYKFTEYTAGRLGGQEGRWLACTLSLPAGTSLADKDRILVEFLNYWILTREGALQAEPLAVAASLDLELNAAESARLVRDLLRYSGGEVAVKITTFFEALADQHLLILPDNTELTYRQFFPLEDEAVILRERASQDAMRLPPSILNQRRDLEFNRHATAETDSAAMKSTDVNAEDEALRSGSLAMAQGTLAEEQGPGPWETGRMQEVQSIAPGELTLPDPALLPQQVRQRLQVQDRRADQILSMNSHNLIASLLSYRSEQGELPRTLDDLIHSGHWLLALRDPVTGLAWEPTNARTPGSLHYERTAPHLGSVMLTQLSGRIQRLSVETPPIREQVSATGLLGEGSFDPEAQQARRTAFQIAKLLELFYYEHGYLPSTVAQLELQGFAVVGYPNPYLGRPTRAVPGLAEANPGDFFYYRLSPTEFLLVGFGLEGERLITIRQPLAQRSRLPKLRGH